MIVDIITLAKISDISALSTRVQAKKNPKSVRSTKTFSAISENTRYFR
jgi:hypothetical protein